MTWIVVFLLANQKLAWIPYDRNQCVAIEESVALGKDVGLTDLRGRRLEVIGAWCMPKDEAEKRFGFIKGTEV